MLRAEQDLVPVQVKACVTAKPDLCSQNQLDTGQRDASMGGTAYYRTGHHCKQNTHVSTGQLSHAGGLRQSGQEVTQLSYKWSLTLDC